MRIVFMGSPDFAVPSLQALAKAGHRVDLVVCQPAKPAGRGRALRGCAVKQQAEALSLEVACPERIRGKRGAPFLEQVEAIAPDFVVVAAYGKILPKRLLAIPRIAPINVHASLLPRWRGASPIHHAILAGDDVTGVSIMHMTPGLDEGAVYTTVEEPILPDDTGGTLSERLASQGARALVEALPQIADGRLAGSPQDDRAATFAPLLKKEDGELDFGLTAAELERRVRAMTPWPGAYTTVDGVVLKVHAAAIADVAPAYRGASPGTVIDAGASLMVACGDQALAIQELQLAGKRRMKAGEFLCGARIAPGARLGS